MQQILDHIRILTDKAYLSEKSRQELSKALLKWFSGQVLKSLKLTTLRAFYKAGLYDAFEELLLACTNVERVAVLNKIDKYRPEIQMSSIGDTMAHLRKLAKAELEPAPKPLAMSKRKASPKQTSKRGILANSKY
jgi:hypothetical protein